MGLDWGGQQPRLSRGLLERIFGYLLPYWLLTLGVLVCIAITAALGLVPALVTKGLVDELARPSGTMQPFFELVALAVGASIATGLIGVLQAYLSITISQGISFEIRRQLFEQLLGQSIGFFTRRRSGDLMARIYNDAVGVQGAIVDTFFGLVANLLIVLSTFALMLALDWKLTLTALLILPLIIGPSRLAGRATYGLRKQTQEKFGEMASYLTETLGISGMLLVKAFTRERNEKVRFGTLSAELRQLEIAQAMLSRWFGVLTNLISTLSPATLLLVGGYLVLTGESSVGTVISIVTVLSGRLAGSVGSLGTTYVNLSGSLALFGRIFQVLDLESEVADLPTARTLGTIGGGVQFEGVSFTYAGAARPALRDVSFEVEPGQLVALVGPSGAGKTTTTYLLARFYDPSQGRVLLDGVDLRDVRLESLSEHIGIVFQDSFLFHASLADNLRYARPDATMAEIEVAARAAHIHDFVTALPDGYETIVGERGHRLSGGEKQRLAIARVILKNPRIVILDEATSSLDTISEQLIQAALQPLFVGRTAFVIAHRLSTVLAANVILVFDGGQLVERGTHESLVHAGGLYADLYERQFASMTRKLERRLVMQARE